MQKRYLSAFQLWEGAKVLVAKPPFLSRTSSRNDKKRLEKYNFRVHYHGVSLATQENCASSNCDISSTNRNKGHPLKKYCVRTSWYTGTSYRIGLNLMTQKRQTKWTSYERRVLRLPNHNLLATNRTPAPPKQKWKKEKKSEGRKG